MPAKRKKVRGRPVAFNRDRALDRAMRVFWNRGFEGASLASLTRAMGLQPPSLYAAFGNKRALFHEALGRYLAGPAAFMQGALDEPTAYRVAQRILRQSAEFLTCQASRCGCMTIQAALVGGEESRPVRRSLTALRVRSQGALQRRFARAQREGDLSREVNAGELARYVTTVFQGMTVQAIDGADREDLLRVAEIALRAWPGHAR